MLRLYSLTNYITTPEEALQYVQELYKLITDGVVKINIYKDYPFSAQGVQQAQRDITSRSTTGKLLIKVSDE